MRVLVTGGRDYKHRDYLCAILDVLHTLSDERPITAIIQGGAAGADRLARDWAILRGVQWIERKANWTKYGKGAGPVRNGEMLKLKPDLVLAFPSKGPGTKNMVEQATKGGFRVRTAESVVEDYRELQGLFSRLKSRLKNGE